VAREVRPLLRHALGRLCRPHAWRRKNIRGTNTSITAVSSSAFRIALCCLLTAHPIRESGSAGNRLGSSAKLPFKITHELDSDYALWLLHFDKLKEYARYAESVIAYENHAKGAANKKEIVYFGTS
jgi:hypothetical protein